MLSYAEAETLLANMYRASGKPQAGAFRGRLKHFKRLGVPLGVNPGRGRKIAYGRNEIYQWWFCLELSEFGIDPSIIVKIVRAYWSRRIFPDFNEMRKKLNADDFYFFLPTEFMSASWSPAKKSIRGISDRGLGWGYLTDVPMKWPDAKERFADVIKPVNRLLIFNVSAGLRELEKAFQVKLNEGNQK